MFGLIQNIRPFNKLVCARLIATSCHLSCTRVAAICAGGFVFCCLGETAPGPVLFFDDMLLDYGVLRYV
jgi:phenylpropionate dioxygenase-like ring-hydroxylating dioxygenase large terminal subunit